MGKLQHGAMPNASVLGAVAHSMFPRTMARRRLFRTYNKEMNGSGEYELRQLPRLVDPKRAAIDVGGNIGTYSFFLSGLASRVIVFEPNPYYAERLRLIKLTGVTVQQVAVSNGEGQSSLRIPFVSPGQEDQGRGSLDHQAVPDDTLSRTVEVPLRSIDSYDFRDVGFIKIDIEGHEERALEGAMRTVERERPNLLIEIEDRHNPGGLGRIVSLFSEIGYDGSFFEDGEQLPVSRFDVRRHQRVEQAGEEAREAVGRSAYVNNFLFQPRLNS